MLHLLTPRQWRSNKRKADLKRKATVTREPIRDNDTNGDNAGISKVLERYPPRRITQNKKTTFVE